MVAVLLLALWRARRLGPVVTEPLPVVVRAAETVEGRARLYRRGGARDTAAEALRGAPGPGWRRCWGCRRAPRRPRWWPPIGGRTGVPAASVGALLYGAAPADDAALVGSPTTWTRWRGRSRDRP